MAIINKNRTPSITAKQEEAIIKAYQNFPPYDNEQVINVPQRDHLGSKFVKGVSCKHDWTPIFVDATIDPKSTNPNREFMKKTFEEDEFTHASACSVCGAACLIEADKIWAYDATANFFKKMNRKDAKNR